MAEEIIAGEFRNIGLLQTLRLNRLKALLLQRVSSHQSFFDIACQILTSTGVRCPSFWLLLVVPAFFSRSLALLDLLVVARRYTGTCSNASSIAGIRSVYV